MTSINTRYLRSSLACYVNRIKTQSMVENKDQDTLLLISLIDKCQKCTHELEKGNIKLVKDTLASIDKDITLLNTEHKDYARIMSLIYNMKAGYYKKRDQNKQALRCIQQAIQVQKQGDVDRIDIARTLLNKSVILGQIARTQTNQYSHQDAITLAKQALQIITQRPKGKQFLHQSQYKLGEIIIISFHNIATELICLKNLKQGYNLYRKANDLAVKVLGPRHDLTIHLKNIINTYKNQKNSQRRTLSKPSVSQQKVRKTQPIKRNFRKTNFPQQNQKPQNNETSGLQKNKTTDVEGKRGSELGESFRMKKDNYTNSYFPELKPRRQQIKDIIINHDNWKQISGRRHFANSMNEKHRHKQGQKSRQIKYPNITMPTKQQRKSQQKPAKDSQKKAQQHQVIISVLDGQENQKQDKKSNDCQLI